MSSIIVQLCLGVEQPRRVAEQRNWAPEPGFFEGISKVSPAGAPGICPDRAVSYTHLWIHISGSEGGGQPRGRALPSLAFQRQVNVTPESRALKGRPILSNLPPLRGLGDRGRPRPGVETPGWQKPALRAVPLPCRPYRGSEVSAPWFPDLTVRANSWRP